MTETEMNDRTSTTGWTRAYWILLVCWVLGAVLTMSRIRGGFLTNYLADLAFPAWFYIVLRGLASGRGVIHSVRWFGQTRERAAMSIFAVGLISEMSQHYWPTGLFAGTYDPWDIVAYASGILACYGIEKFISMRLSGA